MSNETVHDVHAVHCCKEHGCKYGEDDCPVVLGCVIQKYPYELCNEQQKHSDIRIKEPSKPEYKPPLRPCPIVIDSLTDGKLWDGKSLADLIAAHPEHNPAEIIFNVREYDYETTTVELTIAPDMSGYERQLEEYNREYVKRMSEYHRQMMEHYSK